MFITKNKSMAQSPFVESNICMESWDYIRDATMDWENDEFEAALFLNGIEAEAKGFSRQMLIQKIQWAEGGVEHFRAADVHFGEGSIFADGCVVYHIRAGVRTPIFRFTWRVQSTNKGKFIVQWSNRGIFRQDRGSNLVFIGKDDAGVRTIEEEKP